MPKNTKTTRTPRTHTKNHNKRKGRHHKKSGHYVKVYAPYLPLLISVIASVFLSFWRPTGNTLAYATSMSSSDLLSSTNSQRTSNGKAALSLNTQLTSAAQAKANHMVANNYWSHTTPDGQEPWVFIQSAGYSYNKAGENLAYGFATSSDAVIGWMNSPSHKANMLDNTFTEVGFGFANSPSFNGDGQQTVVVAMYGQPQVLAVAVPTPISSSTPTPDPQPTPTEQSSPPAPTTTTATTNKQEAKSKPPKKEVKEETKDATPVTTDQPITATAPTSQNIAKAQTLTNGQAPWILGVVVLTTGAALILLLLQHSLKARHLLHDLAHNTERFVLHRPFLESILIGLVILGVALSRTVGTIL